MPGVLGRKPQLHMEHTQTRNQQVDVHSPLPPPGGCCSVGSQLSSSNRALPAYSSKTRLLHTARSLICKCLEEALIHNLMSIHAIQMNRGNKVFNLDSITSGVTLTVRSAISFNSTEALLCDSILCCLITNSRNTDLNISI